MEKSARSEYQVFVYDPMKPWSGATLTGLDLVRVSVRSRTIDSAHTAAGHAMTYTTVEPLYRKA